MNRTILHTVTRGTVEKTGLHVKEFVRPVGDDQTPKAVDEGPCLKMSLEIEVEELLNDGIHG